MFVVPPLGGLNECQLMKFGEMFVVPPLGGLNEYKLMKFGEKLNQLIGHF